MRTAIYVRVSMREQVEGYSLDAQEQVCRHLAEERGYQVVHVYRDEGLSGKTTERPAFQAMMRDAEAGKLDAVLVHKLDRFSRSVVDVLLSLQDLEERGVSFVSVTENFDFTTPVGRVTLTVLSAIAEWYLGNLGAETAKGKKARAEAGLWNSDVPFGYAVEYLKDGGDGIPYPDEDSVQGVRLAFESYATGQYSDADIARLLNEAGYRPQGRGNRALALFSKDSVRELLQNRFVLGEVQYKGEWYPGKHEPIIAEELFDRCQKARKRRRRKTGTTARANSRVYALSGLARCARCGWPMRGSASARQRYYRDPAHDQGRDCDQRQVRADEAEDAVGDFLRRMTLPANWQEVVLKLIDREAGRGQDILSDRTRIKRQLERLKRLFVLGDLTEREYTVERNRLEAQLAALIPPLMPDLEQAAELLQNIGPILEAATSEERREFMQILLEAVYLDAEKGPAVAIEPRAEYRALFDMVEIADPPNPEDDPGGGMSHCGPAPVAPAAAGASVHRRFFIWPGSTRVVCSGGSAVV
jgi:site-specific DNA recombinase